MDPETSNVADANWRMLSALLRFDLVDPSIRRRRLVELCVDRLDQDYPIITRLLYNEPGQEMMTLAQREVVDVDLRRRCLYVRGFESAEKADAIPQSVVWLRRDVLDGLILDLQNRRTTRANDLAIEIGIQGLALRAVDVSMTALLRRLHFGWLARRHRQAEFYDWKYIEFLRGDPQAIHKGAGYHRRITRLPPGEIAQLSQELPYLHAAELIMLLPDALAADTLEIMQPERQLQVFEELDERRSLQLMTLMAPDIAADLIRRLHAESRERLLSSLPRWQCDRIIDLLRYPEDTVGGLMTNDVLRVEQHWTVGEARDRLRDRLREPDFVYFLYVIESEQSQRLQGVVTLRELLTADPELRLESIMNPYVTTLDPLDTGVNGAYRVIESRLAALPVVAADHRLLGALPVDVAVSQVAPPSWASQMPRVFS